MDETALWINYTHRLAYSFEFMFCENSLKNIVIIQSNSLSCDQFFFLVFVL